MLYRMFIEIIFAKRGVVVLTPSLKFEFDAWGEGLRKHHYKVSHTQKQEGQEPRRSSCDTVINELVGLFHY